MTILKFVCAAFFFLIIFPGCSIKEAAKNGQDIGELRERVAMYWQLKVKEDFMKSYEYEAPYFRKKTSVMDYLRSINTDLVKYISATPGDIKLDTDSAVVDVLLRVRVKPPQMRSEEYSSMIKEKWIRSDGIWYHVPGIIDQREMN